MLPGTSCLSCLSPTPQFFVLVVSFLSLSEHVCKFKYALWEDIFIAQLVLVIG